MNGFIGALAAQLALQPVSPAADGIASRPRRPVAECLRAQRTARAKLAVPPRRSAYLQQLWRVWWADGAAVRMRARVAAARPRPSRDHAPAGCEPAADGPRAPGGPHVNASPHPANGARRCPSRAPGRRRASMYPPPPSRPRVPMPRLFHRGGAHRRSWAPPHPADGLGRGTVGTSMLPLA